MSTSTRPPSLALIYLRGALGFLTKKRSLRPETNKLILPEETLQFSIDPKHVGDFIRVVDQQRKSSDITFPSSDAVPISYLQCLLNGMPMNLMTHNQFPLNIVGSVHESVRIESHRPAIPNENLFARCYMVPEIGLSNKNDWIFTVITDIMNHNETDEKKIMSIANQYRILNPQRHKVKLDEQEKPAPVDYFGSDWQLVNSWNFPGNTGRRYAALNGDINPIHIHPLAGMVFGYKSCIAHGMYSVCALLQEPQFEEKSVSRPCTVAARFTRPLLLPAKEVLCFQKKGADDYVIGIKEKEGELKETVKGSISFGRQDNA